MTETPRSAPDVGPRVTADQMRDITSLRRSSDRRMIGGVAEGLGRHLDVDPLLIRVVFAVLTVFGGAGVVLYVLAWITIPPEDDYDSILSRLLQRDPHRVMTAGLAIAAIVAAITMIGSITFSAPNPVPVLVVSLVAIAALALVSRRQERPAQTVPGGAAPPDAIPADAMPTETMPADAMPTETMPADAMPTETMPADAMQAEPPVGAALTGEVGYPSADDGTGGTRYLPPTPGPPPPPPRPRAPRSHLFGITMAVIAIALGALWVVDETIGTIGAVPPSVYPGTALGIIAVALIVGAWWGRSRLLILAGAFAALATVATAVIGPGPYGQRIYTPASTASLSDTYSHGTGQIVVHLDGIADPANLDGRTIHITSRVGQVQLIVASSIDVGVNAHVDHGDIRGLRAEQDFGQGEKRVTALPGVHAVTVDIELDYGEIVVQQIDCPGSPPATAQNAITYRTGGGSYVPAACN